MTNALCQNCGDIKFGALCPCPCGVTGTGNMDLDILFSDHNMALSTLKQFGSVIKTIHAAANEAPFCHSAFMVYISDHHPEILKVKETAPFVPAARELLSGLTLPEVTILPGIRNARNSSAGEPEHPPDSAGRKWWQFWKRGP